MKPGRLEELGWAYEARFYVFGLGLWNCDPNGLGFEPRPNRPNKNVIELIVILFNFLWVVFIRNRPYEKLFIYFYFYCFKLNSLIYALNLNLFDSSKCFENHALICHLECHVRKSANPHSHMFMHNLEYLIEKCFT